MALDWKLTAVKGKNLERKLVREGDLKPSAEANLAVSSQEREIRFFISFYFILFKNWRGKESKNRFVYKPIKSRANKFWKNKIKKTEREGKDKKSFREREREAKFVEGLSFFNLLLLLLHHRVQTQRRETRPWPWLCMILMNPFPLTWRRSTSVAKFVNFLQFSILCLSF